MGSPSYPREAVTLALEDVHVVDVRKGRILRERTVVIGGDSILAVVPSASARVPASARRIAGDGGYLIPGLWDMHVHAWDRSFSELFLRRGITGIREMGSGIEGFYGSRGVWDFRAAADTGAIAGPRVVAAGAILEGGPPEWYASVPFYRTIGTPADGRAAVDSLANAGADFIKVYQALDPATYRAVLERARAHGLHVVGHVPVEVGAAEAARSGQRSIEHLDDVLLSASGEEARLRSELASVMDTATTPVRVFERKEDLVPRILASLDEARLERLLRTFLENGTWHTPTLVTDADPRVAAPEAGLDSSRLRQLPGWLHRFLLPRDSIRDPSERETKRRWLERRKWLVRRMHDAGIPILAGSDAPNPFVYPGFSLHDELELLVEAGLSPVEALRSATIRPARFLGAADSLGTICAGKRADVVLLAGNPLEDIRHTRRIRAVVAGGEIAHGGSAASGR